MNGLVGLVIALVIAAVLFYAAVWVINWIAPDPPFDKIIKTLVGLILLIYLFGILTGYAPAPTHLWKG